MQEELHPASGCLEHRQRAAAERVLHSKVLLLRPMLTPYIWVVLAIVFYLWGVENIESLLLFILIKVTFLVLIFIAFFKARIV